VTVKKTQDKEPFELEQKVNNSFPKQFTVVLHFMRHYGEPPLEIKLNTEPCYTKNRI